MEFTRNDTQRRLQETAHRFAAEHLRPKAAERDASGAFPFDDLKTMADLGLMGVNIRAEYGGAEAGVVAYSLAVTEIAAGDPAVAVTMAVNNMVGEVIQQFGTDAQRRHYIPKMTSGDFVAGSFCLSEPGAGSDAAGMRTRAVRTDRGWRLNGSKAWITSGTHAGVYLVWARTENDAGDDEISLFLVDPATPGITVGKPEEKMGQHASDTVPITFEDVDIPADAMLGTPGQGFKIAMMALDGGRIGIASQSLGIGREALRVASAFARDEEIDGLPLSQSVEVRDRLAQAATEVEAARLLTLRAAWLKEQGTRRFSREASMAKLFASEAGWKACHAAIAVMGPAGLRHDSRVAKLFRDARVTRIYEGTNEIQRIVIARDLIRQGL